MTLQSSVPSIRVRVVNDPPANPDSDYVLYWMTAFRRPYHNFSLQRAIDYCTQFGKPLVILEALRSNYPWASDRLHQFVIQGMSDNHSFFSKHKVTYYPYVEPAANAGRGLVLQMAKSACVVVTDDFPCFFIPRMIDAFGRQSPVRLEAVDSNGLLPIRATDREFTVAHSFRRYMQSAIIGHLDHSPAPNPLAFYADRKRFRLPSEITDRWPETEIGKMANDPSQLAALPIDHNVPAVSAVRGGHISALSRFNDFLQRFDDYPERRNSAEYDATSHMSAFLHFGHVSAHQLFDAIMEREDWSADDVADKPNGRREGWWGASEAASAFLDQLITWRELGYNMCALRNDYDEFDTLPAWALKTLADHENDSRDHVYSLPEFEAAATHDPIWNAAQRQLVADGTIHNYLRMLWGKKILHWSPTGQDALRVMIELNNKYAIDGRNPNSYSGIFWVLGRYDRAWGPERPIFGKVRYMASENTRRKMRLDNYLARFGSET